MGSVFIRFDEAATRLGVSKRSIHNYLKKGLLRRSVQDGEVLLHKDEVEQLAVEMGADFPALNRKSFFQLMSRLQKMEERMTVVMRMLDIRDNPLRPNINEARALYAAAKESLERGNWPRAEMKTWAGVFDRFDEVALERIQEAVNETNPWAPFFKLVVGMQDFLAKEGGAKPDLSTQTLQQLLDEGRKKIRATVVMWIELGRGTIPQNLLKTLDSDKEALLKKLAK
jgi:predicted DNA-binding protein (UPF0251 family)